MSEFKVTEEMKEVFCEHISASNCRDRAINICFRTKTAIRYGVIAAKKLAIFWKMAEELYPGTGALKVSYKLGDEYIKEQAGE